jgi:TolB-like protein
VAAVTLALAGAAALYFGGALPLGRAEDGPRVVAVLPCFNRSGDPQQEYFSDGVTEQVITQLSTLPDVRIINMISMLQFKNTTKSVEEIGRELNADLIVYCSANRQPEGVRIGAQIVDVRSGDQLWTREHLDESQDVLKPQLNASLSIAEALRLTLSEEGRRRITTQATENDSA